MLPIVRFSFLRTTPAGAEEPANPVGTGAAIQSHLVPTIQTGIWLQTTSVPIDER